MNLNRVMIVGNLTRDPEARVIPSTGSAISSFGVATNRVWIDKQGQKQTETEFHNVVAFGRLAEICNQYLTKGRLVYVEGRLRTRNWAGQDGIKRTRTEIVATNMQMFPRTTKVEYIPSSQEELVEETGEDAPLSFTEPVESKEIDSNGLLQQEKEEDLENMPF